MGLPVNVKKSTWNLCLSQLTFADCSKTLSLVLLWSFLWIKLFFGKKNSRWRLTIPNRFLAEARWDVFILPHKFVLSLIRAWFGRSKIVSRVFFPIQVCFLILKLNDSNLPGVGEVFISCFDFYWRFHLLALVEFWVHAPQRCAPNRIEVATH